MLVMKFGGTSMGSAERMNSSLAIIAQRAQDNRVCVVVSAVGGVSNRLQAAIDEAMRTKDEQSADVASLVEPFVSIHNTIIDELSRFAPGFRPDVVHQAIEPLFDEYSRLLTAVNAFGECPQSIECRIMGLGERACIPIMAELLHTRFPAVTVLDSREYIITSGGKLSEADPVYDQIIQNFAALASGSESLMLAPGFIASDVSGRQSLLGRNGSDFSAALMAMALGAKRLEIWSDVDGIFTADPRIVSDARLVHDISYEEAMELSFFGSKVLHPKTLSPIASRKIETWSLNSFNPSARGTRITCASMIPHDADESPVRGVSCFKDAVLVSVSGAGLKGRRGTAARVFQAVSRSGASALLITQSSSEFTISFCVRASDTLAVRESLNEEFSLEIREGLINEIGVLSDMAIVSIVGDGMKERKGVAGTFFSALAFGGINIHAIAQGSSERSISTVVAQADGEKAVRIAHRFFFNTMQTIELFLVGIGTVGGKLLDQIKLQQQSLRESNIDLQVWSVANSRKMILKRGGLDLSSWKNCLEEATEESSIDGMISLVKAEKPLNPVFVDCTATGAVPERYPDLFRSGFHVVTPNKRANSHTIDFYRQLRTLAQESRKRFLYETNVGAGLPVIDTFKNMLKSGDALLSFSGILSGSLSYIFGRLDEGVPFSVAVGEARDKGFTEPDPRDDLSGSDVARKALIIAREAGITAELSSVTTRPLFPDDFDLSGTTDDFMSRLPSVDSWFSSRIESLRNQGQVLRFVADVEGATGKIVVGVLSVSHTDPLAAIKGGENAFVFTTRHYSPIPLVIRGYGAGADVTASGVFADILRTITW